MKKKLKITQVRNLKKGGKAMGAFLPYLFRSLLVYRVPRWITFFLILLFHS